MARSGCYTQHGRLAHGRGIKVVWVRKGVLGGKADLRLPVSESAKRFLFPRWTYRHHQLCSGGKCEQCRSMHSARVGQHVPGYWDQFSFDLNSPEGQFEAAPVTRASACVC